jgi:hypothetical protein
VGALVDAANAHCPRMVARGGGVRRVYARVVETRDGVATRSRDADDNGRRVRAEAPPPVWMLAVMLDIDVCEAMGANKCNTVAEGVAPEIARVARGRAGLRILTNLCLRRRAWAEFRVPVERLAWKGATGEEVARRVVEAYQFAAADPFRAATHNKGIMNGVDAVAVATGQDWRAIESAAHAFAAVRSARGYGPLSEYALERDAETSGNGAPRISALLARLEMPVPVGTKGGSLQTHPAYRHTHAILGRPTCAELACVIVSVGLAQNFAALRALAIEGINKGHMALHARNIASAAGAPVELAREVGDHMVSVGSINIETAQAYLRAHRLWPRAETDANGRDANGRDAAPPSSLLVRLTVPRLPRPVLVNAAFETFGDRAAHLAVCAGPGADGPLAGGRPAASPVATAEQDRRLQRALLGDKGAAEMETMFAVLDRIRLPLKRAPGAAPREVTDLQSTLKLTSILLNIVASRLLGSRAPAREDGAGAGRVCDAAGAFFGHLAETSAGGGALAEVRCAAAAEAAGALRPLDDAVPGAAGAGAKGGAARRDPENASCLALASPALRAGLPMALALWQTFEATVGSFVRHGPIADALVSEQRCVIERLVSAWRLSAGYGHALSPALRPREGSLLDAAGLDAAGLDAAGLDADGGRTAEATGAGADARGARGSGRPHAGDPARASSAPRSPALSSEGMARFARWLPRLCKRWQATLCLLVDCLVVDPPDMTPARVRFVRQIGALVEFEGTVAHDAARWRRDLRENKPNVLLLWHRLHCRGGEALLDAAAAAAASGPTESNHGAGKEREAAVAATVPAFMAAQARYGAEARATIMACEGTPTAAVFDLVAATVGIPDTIRDHYAVQKDGDAA